MRPHHDFRGCAALPGQMAGERVQGVGHVTVTQVPGRGAPAEHRAVVLLRRPHRPRILLCVEQLVVGHQPVPPHVFHGVALQVDELRDHFSLALLAGAERRREAVDLGIVVAELVEAGVTLPGAVRGSRVDSVQVGDDLVDRTVQAIKVQAVEPRLGPLVAARPSVVLTQPAHEIQHRRITPHPGRETLESSQCLLGGRVVPAATDIPVHPVGIGPVSLGRDRAKSPVLDQPTRNLRPRRVELAGAVGRLADQHQLRVADQIEQHLVGRACLPLPVPRRRG